MTINKRIKQNSKTWGLTVFILLLSFALIPGCAGGSSQEKSLNGNLITPQIQEKVREVVFSVVGVAGVFDYDYQTFHHVLANGKFINDSTSPTGYRLLLGPSSTTVSHKTEEKRGAGLIIYRDNRRYLVLTSRHILFVPDTTYSYYRDTSGVPTDVIFARSIRTYSSFHIIDQDNRLKAGEVLCTDVRSDLALLVVETTSFVGVPFPYTVGYSKEVEWGDYAYVFGYPRGIKQLTLGIVSHAPYPGNFALDIVARSGYSGGPVFVVRPDGRLELAGVIRSVSISKLKYISPPPDMIPGEFMNEQKIDESKADEYDLIDYGIVYAVGASKIGHFLEESYTLLEKQGIHLPSQFIMNR
jgi:S1-C subfamily serine protease